MQMYNKNMRQRNTGTKENNSLNYIAPHNSRPLIILRNGNFGMKNAIWILRFVDLTYVNGYIGTANSPLFQETCWFFWQLRHASFVHATQHRCTAIHPVPVNFTDKATYARHVSTTTWRADNVKIIGAISKTENSENWKTRYTLYTIHVWYISICYI